ncbi:prolyl hydroxylase family protein [Polymorphobacter fuscus]|uniref:Oxygenase n=1 Tax=Sandarakinorhabdus fusca TaxID=1439888 RepID=A0A7C9KHM0_9SPHN|nr:2OG-Fe(II) oxygenase [Polymorphobacter fuscus]KAB7649124.1 2OG-Fe(II) oxygenase [Polymorphobacter fuscus]MQT16581.1 oxygenase [Polymorphobacter fuscus]
MTAFAGAQRMPLPGVTIYVRRDFLDPTECETLIARIEAERRPSALADHTGDNSFRTSETCDLGGSDAFISGIVAKIAAFAGLNAAHAEPLQGQRYAVGQEFKAHTDTFEPGGPDYARFCTVSGQRTWTVMVYLNKPQSGGATRFKQYDKIVQPEAGKLLAWNNLLADGRPNYATLHQGMPVRAGVKHIITCWFRERPWS